METVCGKIFQHLQPNLHYLTLQIANRLTKLTRLLSWSFSTCLQTSLYFFCFLLRNSVLNSSPHSISSWRQEGPGTISKDHRLSVVGCGWTKRDNKGTLGATDWHWHSTTCYIDTGAIPWSETRVITLSEKVFPRASVATYFLKIDFHRPQCKLLRNMFLWKRCMKMITASAYASFRNQNCPKKSQASAIAVHDISSSFASTLIWRLLLMRLSCANWCIECFGIFQL